MKEVVHTKYHKADWSVAPWLTREAIHEAAKYYVHDDVVAVMTRQDTMSSIQALVEANMLRLPFDPILIEFEASPEFRRFVLLRQKGEIFRADSYFLHNATERMFADSQDAEITLGDVAIMVNGVKNKQDGHAIAVAACMALLFLNVKGIEKEVITPTKLNIVREKRNKPPVPTVTTMRIGTVYDRSDRPVQNGALLGHHKRCHLRAGYTRRQHYGKGNELTKIVYIPPCLVNYNPGDEKPAMPVKRVKL